MMRAEMYGLGCLPIIKRQAVEGIVDKNMKLYVLIMKHLDEEHIAIVNSELGTDKEGEGLELWELFKKKYAGSEAHHQMLALGEFIDLWAGRQGTSISFVDPQEKFKLKKTEKVAMIGQQHPGPKRTGKCYNCDIVGHSAKECRKPWTNYKFAPPKANVGEAEGINVSFITVKKELTEPDESSINRNNIGEQCDGHCRFHNFGLGSISDNNTITLRNAFHVPSLPYCLISQTSLWNGGAQISKTSGNNFEVTITGRKEWVIQEARENAKRVA